jgi:hypothetical protein
MNYDFKYVEDLIQVDELEKVLLYMLERAEGELCPNESIRNDLRDKIIFLISNYNRVKKKDLLGLLSYEEASDSLNRIRFIILNLNRVIKEESYNLNDIDNLLREYKFIHENSIKKILPSIEREKSTFIGREN